MVQLVVDRIETLQPPTIRLARIGAVIGAGFRPVLAAQVAGIGIDDCWGRIERLVRANLIERLPGERVHFVHDRVREAMIAGLDDVQRRDLHQAVAEALEASPDEDTNHVFVVAQHYARGHTERNPPRVLETSTAAGLQALDGYANQDAYGWLKNALDTVEGLWIDEAGLASLREALGIAATRIGCLSEAYIQLESGSWGPSVASC